MQNLPLIVNREESQTLLTIANLSEMDLTLEQWTLLGRLVGSILMQLREGFIEHTHAESLVVQVSPARALLGAEELGSHVPFFSYRM